MQGNIWVETAERRIVPEKDGRLKSLLKKSYLTRWVGGSDGSDISSHPHHESPHNMDFARLELIRLHLKTVARSLIL